MSIPDANVTTILLANQSFYSMSSKSEEKRSRGNTTQRRKSFISRDGIYPLDSKVPLVPRKNTDKIREDTLIRLKGYEKEEESRYVELLRDTKKIEEQENIEKQWLLKI